ncbi:MAG TPA: hypothetical protein VMQ83_03065 [Gammaproteobacteria bacterium]|nr:hypothetical protein [Gammaproteobacteria bacterium]
MPSPGFFRTRKRSAVTVGIAATIAVAAMPLFGDESSDPAGPQVDTVVLQLAESADSPQGLAARWRVLQRDPGDAEAAGRYAGLALRHYALSGDARYLGYAEGALAHWQDDANPPLPVWLLRGRILQTQHRFVEAGTDLDRLLATHRHSVEAMLLAADAWRRAGDIDRARSRCAGLALAGFAEPASHCAADILMSLGKAGEAHALLSPLHTGSSQAPQELKQWMLTVAADAAAAAGRDPRARALYERALAIPDASIAMYASYADLLLADGRPDEAIAALARAPDQDADALLLRRAFAAKQLGGTDFEVLCERLRAGFDEARQLGTAALHLREQALFELWIDDDPDAALAYAEQNWTLQKGWEDAALFIKVARAAGRPEAAGAVHDWRQRF